MNNRPKVSAVNNQVPGIDKIFKEDDDDFTPIAGSNLAAIFGIQQKSQDDVRSSPSRPTSGKQSLASNQGQAQSSNSNPKNDVILTEAVHAYKLENGRYMPIGRVAIALTGSTIAKQYNIILYTGTANYISVLPITPEFDYSVQANNYASYDKANWSIAFDNRISSAKFAREICLSKYFSGPVSADGNIISQDLNAVNKNVTAKEGDHISLKYATSSDIAQPLKFDNNLKLTMTLEISKDNNWERSLIGTSMGSRRIMIVPSNKQIGLGPGFPKDRDIIMEIEVMSLFANRELPSQITTKSPEVSQKATIISRMAKMGQSILPKMPTVTTTDSEDTEEEVFHKATRHKRIEPSDSSIAKKHSHSNASSDVSSQKKVSNRGELMPSTLPIAQKPVISATAFAPQWAQGQIQQQYVSIDGQLLPLQQQAIAQPIPVSMDPNLNVFLSETRTQSTELRMGISKINDNVQKILDKFHLLEIQHASTPAADKSLEATLKTLIDMNKNKQDVEPKGRDTQSTLKFEGASGDENLAETNRQLSVRLSAMEKELESANESLIDKSAFIDELSRQNDCLKQTNSVLKVQIDKLEKDLSESRNKNTELSGYFEQFRNKENKYHEQNLVLESHVVELTNKCRELEETMQKSETNDWVDKSKELKEIMTEVYQELCDSFSDDNYRTDHIKSTIFRTIKSITLRVVSEEKEKKKEKMKKVKGESNTETNETFTKNEQNPEFVENNDIREESAVSTMPEQDTINPSYTQADSVPGSRKEPPPVPKFDLESTYH